MNLRPMTYGTTEGKNPIKKGPTKRSKLKAPAKKKREQAKQAKREWIQQRREELSPKMKADIIARDNCTCMLCLKPCTPDDPPHVDHIIPLAQYGRVCESNLATLHASCNIAKGASTKAAKIIMRNIGHALR